MTQPVPQASAPALNLMDFDLPTSNGDTAKSSAQPDPDESALRTAFSSLLTDSGNLWLQANQMLRNLHSEKAKLEAAAQSSHAQHQGSLSNGAVSSAAPAAHAQGSPQRRPLQQQPQQQPQQPQIARSSPQQAPQRGLVAQQQRGSPQQGGARNPFFQQQGGSPGMGGDAAARFLGRIMGAGNQGASSAAGSTGNQGAVSNGQGPARQGASSAKPAAEDSTGNRQAASNLLTGSLDRFANFTRSFKQGEGQGG